MRNSNLLLRYPIKMQPAFKDYIWGGQKLKTQWNKNTPYEITAESWELSAHKNGESYAIEGPLKGLNLSEIIEKLGKGSLGSHSNENDKFPILIKLIDANKTLSVQVHPNDEYALKYENSKGKTECWYIVDATEDAYIYYGFNKTITIEEFRKSIDENTCTNYLNKVNVKKGEVYQIDAGIVHAIGQGCLIAEIQQNSDITYRVFDFNRKDKNNKTRELHIDKACEVANLHATIIPGKTNDKNFNNHDAFNSEIICKNKYFNITEYDVKKECLLNADSKSFDSVLFLGGSGYILHNAKKYSFTKGDSFFIPSMSGEYKIIGKALFLLTRI